MIWYDMMWCDMIWCDMLWIDVIWYDMYCFEFALLRHVRKFYPGSFESKFLDGQRSFTLLVCSSMAKRLHAVCLYMQFLHTFARVYDLGCTCFKHAALVKELLNFICFGDAAGKHSTDTSPVAFAVLSKLTWGAHT